MMQDHEAPISRAVQLALRVAELEDMVRRLTASFECYTAQHKPQSEWDEYDRATLPIWLEALALVGTDHLPKSDAGPQATG